MGDFAVFDANGRLKVVPGQVNLVSGANGVTGILPLANGGTNASGAAVTGGVIYSDATKWLATTAGTAGHYLKSSGTAAPVFSQIDIASTGVSGILAVPNGGTGLATLATGRLPYGAGTGALTSTGTFLFDGTKFTFPGQLQFPATQAASADANCLDDYEEGTWTPTDASGGGLSLTVTSANYTKIGRAVFLTAHFAFPVTADTNTVLLGGAPFTSVAYSGFSIGFNNNGATINWAIPNGSSQFVAQSTAGVAFTNAQFSNSTFVFAGVYFV